MKMFLLMNPPTVTAQESKVAVVRNKPIIYKPEKIKQAKKEIIKHLQPFVPEVPYVGAVELKVSWYFPRGKSHKHLEWRITRPDTDNLEKLLKDCMTELGFWKDDALVASESVCKVWSDEPTGISIEINPMGRFMEAKDNGDN